jgi:6-phosphogluconolactonase (cycloisomerase 2 family)
MRGTMAGSPSTTDHNSFSVAVDTTGNFVYVTNDGSANVSVYTINPSTGTLSSVGWSFATGTQPAGIAVAAVTGP